MEELFFRADDFYASLARDIRAARSSISIEMYIWSNDSLGRRFFLLLEEAAHRGVKVRLLLDGVGSYFWIRANGGLMRASAVETRIWRPVRIRELGLRGLPQAFARLNRRNHKKVALFDEHAAYTGSLNVTGTCIDWKECGMRMEGAAVGLLQELFEDTWQRAGSEPLGDARRSLRLHGILLRSRVVRSNQSYLLRRAHIRSFRRKIKSSRRRIWLMTPYFVPTFGVFLALLQAARRGVDVRLVLPRKIDVWFLRWVARLYYRYMLRAGVQVYEWLPSVLHAKASLIDDWGTIGSSNLNRRSAYLDLELDVVLSPAAIPKLETEFLSCIESSERVDCDEPLGGYRGLAARLLFLVRRWL